MQSFRNEATRKFEAKRKIKSKQTKQSEIFSTNYRWKLMRVEEKAMQPTFPSVN
jgi:hypothetical protein